MIYEVIGFLNILKIAVTSRRIKPERYEIWFRENSKNHPIIYGN